MLWFGLRKKVNAWILLVLSYKSMYLVVLIYERMCFIGVELLAVLLLFGQFVRFIKFSCIERAIWLGG